MTPPVPDLQLILNVIAITGLGSVAVICAILKLGMMIDNLRIMTDEDLTNVLRQAHKTRFQSPRWRGDHRFIGSRWYSIQSASRVRLRITITRVRMLGPFALRLRLRWMAAASCRTSGATAAQNASSFAPRSSAPWLKARGNRSVSSLSCTTNDHSSDRRDLPSMELFTGSLNLSTTR